MSAIKHTTKSGNEYELHRLDNDHYGNPRFVVHFLGLGLGGYFETTATQQAGMSKYKGKFFGGGFVFTSYNAAKPLEIFEEWSPKFLSDAHFLGGAFTGVLTDLQDLQDLKAAIKVSRGTKPEITGFLASVDNGEYAEIWYTTESFPQSLDAIFYRAPLKR